MLSKRILLVEGKSDQLFYEAACSALNLGTTIHVAPPSSVGGRANNKEGALTHLRVLLNQLGDGHIQHLAIVVDADHEAEHGLGYRRTVDRVETIVSEFGFKIAAAAKSRVGGLLFEHPDDLNPFGLWVMPGNLVDGMLEDWLKSCVVAEEVTLFKLASTAVSNLPSPKFKPIFRSKAEVATWLAWQKFPGRGLGYAIEANLVDQSNAQFKLLAKWLSDVFPT